MPLKNQYVFSHIVVGAAHRPHRPSEDYKQEHTSTQSKGARHPFVRKVGYRKANTTALDEGHNTPWSERGREA